MKPIFARLPLVLFSVTALVSAAQGATITGDVTFSSNPPVADVYFYSTPAGNTMTLDGSITLGNGTTADSRLFVGVTNSGQLTLTGNGDATPDSLVLNGYHSSDQVLGRIGFTNGNYLGTINISGGLAVTMGGRNMRYDGNGTNVINITDGSLNYTTSGFGWTEAGASFLNHVLGANGSLILPGTITDATGFTNYWAGLAGRGAESGDVTVAAASGLTLNFAQAGPNTIITAVPEPSAAMALLGGTVTLLGLRRRRS